MNLLLHLAVCVSNSSVMSTTEIIHWKELLIAFNDRGELVYTMRGNLTSC